MIKTRCVLCLIISTLLINFVHTNTTFPFKLRPLRELAFDVKSGPIEVLDNKTFYIPNFHYNGKSHDAHFAVGKGVPAPNTVTSLPFDNKSVLQAFNGQNITVKLTNALTIHDIDFLAIWCYVNQRTFGYVFMNETLRNWKLSTMLPLKLRPFRELAHGLRSGPIEILDNRTFLIHDLYYDGKGPDAHFWVGRGEPAPYGTKVPYQNTIKLPAFEGENVTVVLPDNITITDIEYLSMWCIQYKHNFGHVFMNETLKNWRLEQSKNFLQPFRQLEHFLQSGPIEVVNERTFVISNFYYDGVSPETNFWIGRGSPSRNGTLVPDENNSTRSLRTYNGKNVTIYIPDGFTIDDIDYLAVWSRRDERNFGHVFMEEASGFQESASIYLDPNLSGVVLEEFKPFAHGLRSNPVLLIDERTFFIPNLHYDGKAPDAHFWVGNGSEPSASGTKILGENQVYTKTLPQYTGQSIYIRLPDNITVRDINYVAVWCIQFEQNFGHINIPKNVQIPKSRKYPHITDDGRVIVRVPKCCSLNMIVEHTGCQTSNIAFNITANVHMSNQTHLNDVAMTKSRIVFVPYIQNINCLKYPLEPDGDNYSLLTSGNMLYISEKRQLTLDEYCIDTVKIETKYITTAFVCTVIEEARNVFVLYAVCIFISCVFLIITCSLYCIIDRIRDTRGICIIGYTGMMAMSFLCLGFTQIVVTEQACHVLGFIFQFTIVSSFTWFTALCYETLHFAQSCLEINREGTTEEYTERINKRRKMIYLGLALTVPLIVLIASIIYNVVPLMPTNYLESSCRFTSDIQKKLFLFVPVVTSIIINVIILVWTGIFISRNAESQENGWIYMKDEINWKFRSCAFLVLIMMLCWFAEVVTYLFDTPVTFLDLIHSLQGVMVCAIILSTNPPRENISRYFRNTYSNWRKGGDRGNNGTFDDVELENLDTSRQHDGSNGRVGDFDINTAEHQKLSNSD